MKKKGLFSPENLFKFGAALISLMSVVSFTMVIMISSKLKLVKTKMQEASEGIDKIVEKFKKAGEKYDSDIDSLKKSVESLKSSSSSSSDEEKPAKKPAAEKKSDDAAKEKPAAAKKGDASSGDDIQFKDAKPAKPESSPDDSGMS